jgi:hypothetical protein
MDTFKSFSESSEDISIEVLMKGSTWNRVEGGVPNRSQSIARAMEMAKKRYKDNRVRAVGSKSGRVYDMLS